MRVLMAFNFLRVFEDKDGYVLQRNHTCIHRTQNDRRTDKVSGWVGSGIGKCKGVFVFTKVTILLVALFTRNTSWYRGR